MNWGRLIKVGMEQRVPWVGVVNLVNLVNCRQKANTSGYAKQRGRRKARISNATQRNGSSSSNPHMVNMYSIVLHEGTNASSHRFLDTIRPVSIVYRSRRAPTVHTLVVLPLSKLAYRALLCLVILVSRERVSLV